MSPVISTVKRKHAYTGCDIPWTVGEALQNARSGCTADPKRRLVDYMSSGGGLPQIGLTSEHELVSRRQRRFLVVATILAVAWVVAIFV